jgi:hypothetical protein
MKFYKEINGYQVFTNGRELFTNKRNLPQEIVSAIMKERYHKEGEKEWDASASTLTAPTQQVVLKEIHKDNLIIRDVVDFYWQFLGSVAHQILEDSWHEDMGSVVEIRVYQEVLGQVISGMFDCFAEPEIRDYKTTKVYKMQMGDFYDWECGQNVYAWLLRKDGKKVERLNVFAFLGDWKAGEMYKEDYPPCQIMEIPLKLWTMEEQEVYIKGRVQALIDARSIPKHEDETVEETLSLNFPCSNYEMWNNTKDVCIWKDEAKKATPGSVFKVNKKDSGSEAVAMANAKALLAEKYADKPEYKILTRRSGRTRCLRFCDVAHVCHQNSQLCAEEGLKVPVRLEPKPLF